MRSQRKKRLKFAVTLQLGLKETDRQVVLFEDFDAHLQTAHEL